MGKSGRGILIESIEPSLPFSVSANFAVFDSLDDGFTDLVDTSKSVDLVAV